MPFPKQEAGLEGVRILHIMLRVADLQRSIDFYETQLGMRIVRREDHHQGRFTLAFLGYGAEEAETVLELTHNWDGRDYTHGTAFGHLALGVGDVYAAVQRLADSGVRVTRPPGPLVGRDSEIIAFIEDPDGYKIELIERPKSWNVG